MTRTKVVINSIVWHNRTNYVSIMFFLLLSHCILIKDNRLSFSAQILYFTTCIMICQTYVPLYLLAIIEKAVMKSFCLCTSKVLPTSLS